MVCLVSMPAAPTSLAFVATTAENMLSTFSLSHKGLTLSRAGEVSHVTRPSHQLPKNASNIQNLGQLLILKSTVIGQ
jgi:hypothetical protein